MERGNMDAARINLIRTLRDESPSEDALRRATSRRASSGAPQAQYTTDSDELGNVSTSHEPHTMRLRSQDRDSRTPEASPESTNDTSQPSAPNRLRLPRGRIGFLRASPITPESNPSATASNAGSPGATALESDTMLASTPSRSKFRPWRLESPPKFTIRVDSSGRNSEETPPGHVFSTAIHDDKENDHVTDSDHQADQGQRNRIAEARLRGGPVDVFGLPINSTSGHVLTQLPLEPETTTLRQPLLFNTRESRGRSGAAMLPLQERARVEGDLAGAMSPPELTELGSLNASIDRDLEQRRQNDRHAPSRNANVQGQ